MARAFASFAVVGYLVALAIPNVALSQSLVALGSEFQVNARTSNAQDQPFVGMDDDGDFVVVWSSLDQDGSGRGVFARRFNAGGVGLGAEFQVNTNTKFDQREPSVAADSNGDFVVAWSSDGQDGFSYGIFARRFNSSGIGLAAEFQVNAYTSSSQRFAAVGMDNTGDFVVAWASLAQDGANEGVFARRFNAAGVGLGAEFQVNAYTPYPQSSPAVGMNATGDFVVSWSSFGQDGDMYGVFARLFKATGIGVGGEFQVTSFTSSLQSEPAVGMDSSGGFVVAWRSYQGEAGSFDDVFAQRFDADRVRLGGEFQINSETFGGQGSPAVGVDSDGDFVVAWESGSLSDTVVSAQSFNALGVALGAELQVSVYSPSNKSLPALGMDGDGDFVVAWSSDGQDGSSEGVFARRYATFSILDIDANGTTAPLTDGLLVLRFLFGFTGATLTTGAVDLAACTRCTAVPIEAYLQTLI